MNLEKLKEIHKDHYRLDEFNEEEYLNYCPNCSSKNIIEIGEMTKISQVYYKHDKILVHFECNDCNHLFKINNIALAQQIIAESAL